MKSKELTSQPEMVFNLLSDVTRLRCLALIYQVGELCVCELTYSLKITQPKVSRHLALLRKLNFIAGRRDGLWIYYRIHPNLPKWIKDIIKLTINSIGQIEPYQRDRKRVEARPNPLVICQK
jgi:ArsR family transcriptional regulator, arsenate/arsenite/antimonite-responsive transcriptional repressor